jgi:hypothetical protein
MVPPPRGAALGQKVDFYSGNNASPLTGVRGGPNRLGGADMHRLVGLLVATMVVGGIAGAALAATPTPMVPTCPNLPFNTGAQSGDGHLHRGDRVNTGMWIEATDAACIRVSSVFITSNDLTE